MPHRQKVFLHFSDGQVFQGFLFKDRLGKINSQVWGEAAFTTSMSGYQETITDPSYLGQHLIFAYPHIGNYPIHPERFQSKKPHVSSIMARSFSPNDYWDSLDIPLIEGFDTRAIVKYMTQTNQHISCLSLSDTPIKKNDFTENKITCNDLNLVGQKETEVLIQGSNPIVIVNYGIKQAIVDHFKSLGRPLVMVSHLSSAKEILSLNPKLVFLSNGPGDPRLYKPQIQAVSELIKEDIPIRGICLGHQLISLALGGDVLKLPFGQRGSNHPVLEHETGNVCITSQNHGYALDTESFQKIANNNPAKRNLFISSTSLFDHSIEGIASYDGMIRSVQFHPEANPGPLDASPYFQEIKNFLNDRSTSTVNLDHKMHEVIDLKSKEYIKDVKYKKVLVIGSGPIKIGQASEFDYSGTQACRSLKEKGLEVVLLNSNPATIMTDKSLSDRTYIEPITLPIVKSIIEKENVDAVISTMGGQTALNLCLELEKTGFLKERNIKLLGANSLTIEKTENRDLFAAELKEMGFKTGIRLKALNEKEAFEIAQNQIHYPLLIRRDFALGGQGAALVHTEEELKEVISTDIKFPITLERSLHGFKEVEFEVMVDQDQNGVIICSIENIDPCGVHTGDSITVAPAQTLSDNLVQRLRTMSLDIAKRMGVVAGGANVQFAINPKDEQDIVVIEMNPRVSRSSALASKATGYPIAKISALLAIGYTLKEILNDITKASPVCFEPSLDYVAVKIPIFPFHKFPSSGQELGPQMRSVGEVLSLGSNFNEAFLKALRGLEIGLEIPRLNQIPDVPITISKDYIEKRLNTYQAFNLLSIMEAQRLGIKKETLHEWTKISPWFIDRMQELVNFENYVQNDDFKLTRENLLDLKKSGFSDKHLALLLNKSEREILEFRLHEKIVPVYKSVDTCSGEFQAQTPYFYGTYQTENEAKPFKDSKQKAIAIIGSGPNRIGQGIEFDYACVKASKAIQEKAIRSILINSNPETVSTDYDSSDRLYLSPLYIEDVFDILYHENPEGVIACFSGQTGIKIRQDSELTFRKDIYPINFYGAKIETLELTEDRKAFGQELEHIDISKTKSKEVQGYQNLLDAMLEIGFPVIIRPSYVIGGESMYIFHSHDDINQLPGKLKKELQNSRATFLVETYLENALELDIDLIRDEFDNTYQAICEHIEYAGVHSGDSGMMTPPILLTAKLKKKLEKVCQQLAKQLNVIGPINFQFAVKDEQIYCIEANPRGSRTIPFLSKAMDVNMTSLAVDAMLGEKMQTESLPKQALYFSVKQSTFPFDRFIKDDIILGPKMRSTGETMGIDFDKNSAVLKSYLANYPAIANPGKILISLSNTTKEAILPYVSKLSELGYSFYATPGTCGQVKALGFECEEVAKLKTNHHELINLLKDDETRLVFNTPTLEKGSKSDGEVIRNTAIQHGVPCFTMTENIKAVIESLITTKMADLKPYPLQDLTNEYRPQ